MKPGIGTNTTQQVSSLRGKGALGALRSAAGGPVNAYLLGLAAVRVWLQSNLFASYTQSDDGIISIISNFAYGATMVIGALFFFLVVKKPSKRIENGSAIFAFFIMTIATMLILVGKEIDSDSVLFFACILAGIGGAFGGAMWTVVYVRLGFRRAVLYTFISLGLGSLGGLLFGFLPDLMRYVASLFMPAISILCFQRARKLPVEPVTKHVDCYDKEPKSTIFIIFGGIAVFGFVLGISRGFPAGDPTPMTTELRLIHQLGVVALSCFVIWWSTIRGKRLSFSFLWRIEIMIVAAAMFLLAVFPGNFTELAIAVVNIADNFMLGVLWITLYDVSRHSSWHSYVIYGSVWALRIFFRNFGRIFIGAIAAFSDVTTTVVGIIVFALAASMALLLSEGIPQRRPLLLDEGSREKHSQEKREQDVGPSGGQGTEPRSSSPSVRQGVSQVAGPLSTPLTPAAPSRDFQRLYALSDREMEIITLISQGRSKAYIAENLYLSENTVRSHSKRIYNKLDIHSKQELLDLLQYRPEDY